MSYALPECEGPSYLFWTNCVGTETDASGGNYVGGYKNNKRDVQGTFIVLVLTGICDMFCLIYLEVEYWGFFWERVHDGKIISEKQ